ncbi:hypothetical protein A5622_04665 [Mycobacterium sp. 1245801.1]|nr:hypothetical protein A5622_04665 [Mycobacterium sp. 1245801.1]
MENHVERTADLLDQAGVADVVLHEPVPGMAGQPVIDCAGGQVVHADHLDTGGKEPIAQVRAEESGTAGDQSAGERTYPALVPVVPAVNAGR